MFCRLSVGAGEKARESENQQASRPLKKSRPGARPTACMALLALIMTLAVLMPGALGCGKEEQPPDLTSVTAPADTATQTGGRLQIAETEYDFGSVPVGETVSHSFEIKNTGNGILVLDEPEIKRLEGC